MGKDIPSWYFLFFSFLFFSFLFFSFLFFSFHNVVVFLFFWSIEIRKPLPPFLLKGRNKLTIGWDVSEIIKFDQVDRFHPYASSFSFLSSLYCDDKMVFIKRRKKEKKKKRKKKKKKEERNQFIFYLF